MGWGGGAGGEIPFVEEEYEILLGVNFFSAGDCLRRYAFNHSSLFQVKKHSVYTEHQPVCTEYEVKMKIVLEQ